MDQKFIYLHEHHCSLGVFQACSENGVLAKISLTKQIIRSVQRVNETMYKTALYLLSFAIILDFRLNK